MRKLLVLSALTLGVTQTMGTISAASAASPTVAKRSVTTTASKYWLSDGLNRLVFWQPPANLRGERSTRQ